MAEKMTIEKLAEMTQNEFRQVRGEMATMREEMATKDVLRDLNEKMDAEFIAVRSEMQQGFRAVLAAIESVEYTKLRIRLDSLETRMEKMERAGEK